MDHSMFFFLEPQSGYGNVTPETRNGKIFCLLFVTIGIPYFGYMMSILSDNINIVILKTGKKLEFKLKRGLPAYMGTVTFVSIGLFFIVCLPLFLFMYMEARATTNSQN